MKFYRVKFHVEHGSSGGFSWHTSNREAKKAIAQWAKDYGDDPEEEPPKIEEVEIKPTKKGILRTLNGYASHPDNG